MLFSPITILSEEMFSIGMLGILGCNYFLLSANYGTLDKVVDDGSKANRTIRIISSIAPIIIVIACINVFLVWKDKDTICALMWVLMLLPAIPASYLNLKHILLPVDDFGFLKATRLVQVLFLYFLLILSNHYSLL